MTNLQLGVHNHNDAVSFFFSRTREIMRLLFILRAVYLVHLTAIGWMKALLFLQNGFGALVVCVECLREHMFLCVRFGCV